MIIGLHGKAGSGKDASYRLIQQWAETMNLRIRREAFADRLKLSALRALGFELDQTAALLFWEHYKREGWQLTVTTPDGAVHVITGRRFCQYYGDEAHRQMFGTDFWIAPVLEGYDPDELLVITDVRYVNEAQAIVDLGGEIWQLLRPREAELAEAHTSEQPLPEDLIHHTIVNDRGEQYLYVQLIHYLERTLHGIPVYD